jgi:hypothetical protein
MVARPGPGNGCNPALPGDPEKPDIFFIVIMGEKNRSGGHSKLGLHGSGLPFLSQQMYAITFPWLS